MASFPTLAPAISFEGANAFHHWDYFLKQQAFLQDVAKLDEPQAFVASNKFVANGGVQTGGILLANNYHAFVDIQVASSNLSGAAAGGGNAALYVQHYIDGSAANSSNVNSGIRVQIETLQKRAVGTYTNDVVAGYFGVRNRGTDVGAFGIHVDAYSNGVGAATTMYGMSAEMYREANTGFTVAFHARSIDAVGYFDNDYGFLASPSVAGTKKFKSVFAAGSAQTGTMLCDFGLDLRNTNAGTAQIAMAENHYLMWNGNTSADVQTRYETAGVVAHYVAGTYQFGIENTGRLFIVNNANTVVATAFVPSGNSLVMNIGGTLFKVALGVFP